MSFLNPSAAIKNSSIPIGKVDTSVVTAKISSSANELLVRNKQTIIVIITTLLETLIIISIMYIMSRTGYPHII